MIITTNYVPPENWTDLEMDWDGEDVSCQKAKYVDALYKAVEERKAYTGVFTYSAYPTYALPIPYRTLRVGFLTGLHSIIRQIIPYFLNHTVTDGDLNSLETVPAWTESDLLRAIGAEKCEYPQLYNMDNTAWLIQQYQIVNLLKYIEVNPYGVKDYTQPNAKNIYGDSGYTAWEEGYNGHYYRSFTSLSDGIAGAWSRCMNGWTEEGGWHNIGYTESLTTDHNDSRGGGASYAIAVMPVSYDGSATVHEWRASAGAYTNYGYYNGFSIYKGDYGYIYYKLPPNFNYKIKWLISGTQSLLIQLGFANAINGSAIVYKDVTSDGDGVVNVIPPWDYVTGLPFYNMDLYDYAFSASASMKARIDISSFLNFKE